MRVGRKQIKRARQADLYEYLLDNYPDTVRRCGSNVIQNIEYDSLKITKGHGYIRFSDGDHGNAIDYLEKYLGYEFQDAVMALLDYAPEYDEIETSEEITRKKFREFKYFSETDDRPSKMPDATLGPFNRVFAYLNKTRKIPAEVINRLIKEKLLYQDINNNCVFVSSDRSFAEIKGTLSERSFKGCRGKDGTYWAFETSPDADSVYFCESAVDAVSLYCLYNKEGVYIALGGCEKWKALFRASATYSDKKLIIAFDNDSAGNDAFRRAQDRAGQLYTFYRLQPELKDWNEMLQARY